MVSREQPPKRKYAPDDDFARNIGVEKAIIQLTSCRISILGAFSYENDHIPS